MTLTSSILPLRPVHVQRPKKVSNGLFDAGLEIALIALAESSTSPKHQQLLAPSSVDRGRVAVGIVAKRALKICRRAKKRELTLELMRKAKNRLLSHEGKPLEALRFDLTLGLYLSGAGRSS